MANINHLQTEKKSRFRLLQDFRDHKVLWLMFLPIILFFVVFSYIPMVGIYLAFTRFDFNLGFFQSPFVGLKNFEYLFKSGILLSLVRNTILYNLAFLFLGNLFQLACAVFLSDLKNRAFVKTSQSIIFLPYFISMVLVGLFAYNLFNIDNGFVNTALSALGLSKYNFYNSPQAWPPIIVAVNVWKGLGYGSIVYLSAITTIDSQFYEAARIDGATKWQQFKKITFPLLMASINNVVVLSIIGGLKVFDIVVATTGGGPGYATEVFNTMIYNSYSYQKYGEATAGTTLLAGMILIITLCTYRTIAKNEVEL